MLTITRTGVGVLAPVRIGVRESAVEGDGFGVNVVLFPVTEVALTVVVISCSYACTFPGEFSRGRSSSGRFEDVFSPIIVIPIKMKIVMKTAINTSALFRSSILQTATCVYLRAVKNLCEGARTKRLMPHLCKKPTLDFRQSAAQQIDSQGEQG